MKRTTLTLLSLLCISAVHASPLPENLGKLSKSDLHALMRKDGTINHETVKNWQHAAREQGVGEGPLTDLILLGENKKVIARAEADIKRLNKEVQGLTAQIAKAKGDEKATLKRKKASLLAQLGMLAQSIPLLQQKDAELVAKVKKTFKKQAKRTLSTDNLLRYQTDYAG